MQLIGEGGTSRIFKALQQPINRIVALKIPSFAQTGSVLTPDEFLSEATLMARLEHGNIVRIYDFGVQEDKAFICMEYVEGWNLLELIGARGPLSVSAVLAAALPILDGLLYAHSQGVLHLDLSPANVLVSKTGVAKLSDFGMAGKKFRASRGKIVGTPAFLSPEHVSGAPGTTQSDLFSFASLLYFAATGEPLFDPGEGNSRVTQAIGEIEAARAHPPEDRIGRLPHLLAKPVLTALQSVDPEGLMRGLREAWKKAEGEERTEAVLRRDLELDGDPLAPGHASGGLPDGQDLRDQYLGLRAEGRHREAVALLEKALRRQPDNPLLRELLATPAKAKSAPITVEVGEVARRPAPAIGSAPDKGRRARGALLSAAALTVMVALGWLAWGKARAPDAERKTVSPALAGPPPPGAPAPAMDGPAAEPTHAEAAKSLPMGPHPESIRSGAAAKSPPLRGAAPATASRTPALPRRPRPPAVALSGPAGTKVAVDDTLEWTSPGPADGWPLAPGLVNITLTPPGAGKRISSSLYVSADTLYLLNLEADGGFSVSRKRR